MSSVVGDSQISLKKCRRHLLAAIQLAVSCCELYFARCCAVKRTGTFASESKVTCLFYLILRSGVLIFRIPKHLNHVSVCQGFIATEKS